jgi:diguanylate cyclase (GGDEF)-like protein
MVTEYASFCPVSLNQFLPEQLIPVTLPGFKMVARAEKMKSTGTADRSRGRVLLIADDDQSTLVQALSTRGIEVVEVSNGSAAIVSLQRSRPQVVIANPRARGLSGTELAKMLAQSNDGIPLVLAGTEPATVTVRLDAMREGAFDYFEVPRDFELLLERTQQLVRLRQKIDRLREDADLDHLTGLANRRRFRVALIREVERWRRYGVPCSLLLIDIDHLKGVNDKYGHPAGDEVIRQVAHTISVISRDNDTAARLGGEEFALLLAGVDVEKATAAAERLREVVASRRVEGVGMVTVSIGVSGCPISATSDRALYSASDSALYVAKNGGRNRVALAPPLQDKLPGV